MKVYKNLNQCFHSKESIYKESTIADKHITQIHFDIIAGRVHIGFHNKSTFDIRVWDMFRSLSLVDPKTFDSGVSLNNSIINIHSVTPAFNFKSCQHAFIEILVPNNYSHISLTGTVKMGLIQIQGNGHGISFSNIDIVVDVGAIEIKHVMSYSLSLAAELGAVKVSDTIVPIGVKLHTRTGIIRTNDLITKSIHSINDFGCSMHHDLVADNARFDTRFGWNSVHRPTSLTSKFNISMNTEYGRSLILLDSNEVNFTLGTKKGSMVIEYEDDRWNCHLDKQSTASLNGNCSPKKPTKIKGSSAKIDINTKFGLSNLIVDEEVEEK